MASDIEYLIESKKNNIKLYETCIKYGLNMRKTKNTSLIIIETISFKSYATHHTTLHSTENIVLFSDNLTKTSLKFI